MTKKIAFQGVYGANSDLACRQFYPDYQTIPQGSFFDVFKAVENDEVAYGMIPLENSYAGRVSEIHNLLQDSNIFIVAEHFAKIEHHLAATPGTKLEDVKEIYSHPQALMQCRKNLSEMHVKQIECSNTAEAAKFIAAEKSKTKAALCSKLAAELNGLEIIKSNLQDSGDENFTVFIVISKHASDPNPEKGKVITTMLFTVRNIPGALYKALGGFATNGVNLLKWESYIPSGKSSQAKFFISIEGHPSEKHVSLALEEVGFFSKSVKLLGVYYADKARYE
ncbi:MAG: prephenate dehydratase [Rickettsiaceae bacterium]|jgi:prephenate dehydratase|nr:prephenate dehydratase [Rickettsiaceae bacterium]